MNLDRAIREANSRLKAGGVGLTIEHDTKHSKSRLVLRGILPPRPGATRTDPYQQRLYLGVGATVSGVKAAEAEAKKIAGLIAFKQFSWGPYSRVVAPNQPEPPKLADDWLRDFEKHYRDTYQGKNLERMWGNDYERVFREIPSDQVLTAELVLNIIRVTQPGTRLRQRFCIALGALCRYAGVTIDLSPYRVTSGKQGINPKDLPSDEEIVKWWHFVDDKDPAWGWCYGMIATYGLRPGEVFHVVPESVSDSPGIISIRDGKTGGRGGVLPLYPEWWEVFRLDDVPPRPTDAQNPAMAMTKYFRDTCGVPFIPYAMRHAWAGRAALFGIDAGSAAHQMGHSLDVHHRHYSHWYNDAHQRRVFNLIMSRADRPQPPTSAPGALPSPPPPAPGANDR